MEGTSGGSLSNLNHFEYPAFNPDPTSPSAWQISGLSVQSAPRGLGNLSIP